MSKSCRNTDFIVCLAVIALSTVLICVGAVRCSGQKLDFKSQFYFVYYRSAEDYDSAEAYAGMVADIGGAGYVLDYNGGYYVTVACYYNKSEADSVCAELVKNGYECSVLAVETTRYRLQSRAAVKNRELYLNNLSTLLSLSRLSYECANGLDTGAYGQEKAKNILKSITATLTTLEKSNRENCFYGSINALREICESRYGYLLSRDMRYVQIALADAVAGAQLK